MKNGIFPPCPMKSNLGNKVTICVWLLLIRAEYRCMLMH